jgi:hypothetical protein
VVSGDLVERQEENYEIIISFMVKHTENKLKLNWSLKEETVSVPFTHVTNIIQRSLSNSNDFEYKL